MIQLPDMTIEARESTTAHGITPPNVSASHIALQIQQAVQLNEDAKQEDWQDSTFELIQQYLPIDASGQEIVDATCSVTGFESWAEVSCFVVDDMCADFFNLALAYCLREGQQHRSNSGFIDGSGIGYLKAYLKRLKQTLEEAFDAKYFFKLDRPLVCIAEKFGMDFTLIANAIHPGHWSYPAGHGTKFLTAVEVLRDVFYLDKNCYRTLLIVASVLAMGRSGNLIHYPMDNLAAGSLTDLQEFK
jgi:hypothetical protein